MSQNYWNAPGAYLAMIAAFLLCAWLIVGQGRVLEEQRAVAAVGELRMVETHPPVSLEPARLAARIFGQLLHNLRSHPFAVLALQIVVIVSVARLAGRVMRQFGQPAVVGEILAGIALGPSLLGSSLPAVYGALFPASSLPPLQMLAQVGMVLFLFVVGMELDLTQVQGKARNAIIISHASIVVPFALGMALALQVYVEYAPTGVSFLAFALFIGIAMSVTAFPVLARILQERNLLQSRLGTMAITCAAADDVTAWSLLAVVVTVARAGDPVDAVATLSLALLFIAFMLYLVRPVLGRLAALSGSRESLTKGVLAACFVLAFASALSTELIGIHALFGAFLAGAIMPDRLKVLVAEKVRDFSVLLLLPLFFAFTGLRTEIGLLNSAELWVDCALVLAVAVLGKLAGSAVAARLVGESWHDALTLGVLMNTRGLMELVVLNVGYDLGILSRELFAMLVLMALATTAMTGPGLFLLGLRRRSQPAAPAADDPARRELEAGAAPIQVAFARPDTIDALLRVARVFSDGGSPIHVMHFTPDGDRPPDEIAVYMSRNLESVKRAATRLDMQVRFTYRATDDVMGEILSQTRETGGRLLLVGGGQSVLSLAPDGLGGKIRSLLRRAPCTTGVLIDGNPDTEIQRVLLALGADEAVNRRLLDLFFPICKRGTQRVDVVAPGEAALPGASYSCFGQIRAEVLDADLRSGYDLLVLDVETYRKLRPAAPCLVINPQ